MPITFVFGLWRIAKLMYAKLKYEAWICHYNQNPSELKKPKALQEKKNSRFS